MGHFRLAPLNIFTCMYEKHTKANINVFCLVKHIKPKSSFVYFQSQEMKVTRQNPMLVILKNLQPPISRKSSRKQNGMVLLRN